MSKILINLKKKITFMSLQKLGKINKSYIILSLSPILIFSRTWKSFTSTFFKFFNSLEITL